MICASGTLGQIIPPSLVLILLAEILNESVGTMFAAAMIPGLTLAASISWRSWCRGAGSPAPDAADPARNGGAERTAARCARLVLVVGPPDRPRRRGAGLDHRWARRADRGGLDGRARGAGIRGAVRAAHLRLLARSREVDAADLAMVFFILICAQVFGLAFRGLGGEHLVQRMFEWVPGARPAHCSS
jgi:hypothetical protein